MQNAAGRVIRSLGSRLGAFLNAARPDRSIARHAGFGAARRPKSEMAANQPVMPQGLGIAERPGRAPAGLDGSMATDLRNNSPLGSMIRCSFGPLTTSVICGRRLGRLVFYRKTSVNLSPSHSKQFGVAIQVLSLVSTALGT
jgi:hypothetical protein